MDIHRLRIVPYPASPINALAFSHDSDPKHRVPYTLRLAVGRANGDVELWNPSEGRWVQERIFRGSSDRSIEGLAWTQDPTYDDDDGHKSGGKLRLFSIGYSSVVTEWDMSAGKPLRHSSGGNGEIWCVAAQPRAGIPAPTDAASADEEKYHQKLVAGCANGTLVLHSTAGGDLKYLRILPPPTNRKARVLSVTWQSADCVVAGYSDNAIRLYDIRGRGRNIHTMSIGPGTKGAQEVLVWAVRCLSDGTIISGDSAGEIKIWDAQTLSMVQQLKSHNADVLTLSPSFDGNSLVSGGIDRRTVFYQRFTSDRHSGRWAAVSHRRLHASDVKSMASFEGKKLSVVVSGGLDATPVVLPRHNARGEQPRRLAVHPSLPPLHSAPSSRLIMSFWNSEVRIWRVNSYDAEDPSDALSHRLVAKIELQGNESITTAALASNGTMLAVSTVSSTRIFRLRPTLQHALRVQKMKIPSALAGYGSSALEFSPDHKWLLQVQEWSDPRVFRIRCEEPEGDFTVEPKAITLNRKDRSSHTLKAREGTYGSYARTIQRFAWSSNSRLLVICDVHGHFDSWVLEGHEDLAEGRRKSSQIDMTVGSGEELSSDDEEMNVVLGQRWTLLSSGLPKLGASPLILSFRPPVSYEHAVSNDDDVYSGEDRLVVVSSKHHMFEYHVTSGILSDWSRRNPPETLPLEFSNIRERAMGCVWDTVMNTQRLWLYGSSWLWMFDLSQDMQSSRAVTDGTGNMSSVLYRKRKRGVDAAVTQKLMQNTVGAGSRIGYTQRDSGMMPGILETEGETTKFISLEPQEGDPGDGSEIPRTTTELVAFRRRNETDSKSITNGTHDGTLVHQNDKPIVEEDDSIKSAPQWGTFKYRPILGIVPLSASHGPDGRQTSTNPEVAVVERPLWDVDLPPRWEGRQEWQN